MNKAQVLILIAIVVLVGYYFSQGNQGNKPVEPAKKINAQPATTPDDLSPRLPTKTEIILEPPADLFPDSNIEVREPINEVKLAADQPDWFTDKCWLSDREIDWALEWVINDLPIEQATKYKVLESTQFMFAREVLNDQNPDAMVSFPTLLSELTTTQHDLVFIPVNNPDFHWSLLIYETSAKKFWHFDTLRGANDSYVQPLVKELLQFLLEEWQDPIHHWETRYHLKQGNSWDCGVAVIEIARQIMRDYPTYQRILLYTKLDFDFGQAREDWRGRLTKPPN